MWPRQEPRADVDAGAGAVWFDDAPTVEMDVIGDDVADLLENPVYPVLSRNTFPAVSRGELLALLHRPALPGEEPPCPTTSPSPPRPPSPR
ncbi:hypothetical protein LV78_006573 [Actinosynnema pretiosum]|nr:hypothetical protein [Actinosynnema pretiosum]